MVLGSAEFGNLLLDSFVDAGLEFRPVAQHKEKFEPDEQRGKENGLHKVIKERGGSTFECTVADELKNPAGDMDQNGDLVRQL